jgi:hypothetical protein
MRGAMIFHCARYVTYGYGVKLQCAIYCISEVSGNFSMIVPAQADCSLDLLWI